MLTSMLSNLLMLISITMCFHSLNGYWGLLPKFLGNPTKAAENRNESFAISDYDKDQRKIERLRKQGKIGDREYYKEMARLNTIREYRIKAGQNPESQVCVLSPTYEGSTKVLDIPSACEEGFEPWVYHNGPKRTFEVDLTTGEGDPLAVFPEFVAEYGSTAECDEKKWTCVFEGTVYYHHESGGKHRILKLTPTNE